MEKVTKMRSAMGPMLMFAAIAPLSAHATAAAQQVVIGQHHQTHASQTLQNDVLATAHEAVPAITAHFAGQEAIACGKMELADTMVTKLVANGPWSEQWTWTICGNVTSVPIEFTPDGKGGTNFAFKGREATVTKAN